MSTITRASRQINLSRRTLLRTGAAGVAVGGLSSLAAPAIAQSKPFDGVTLRGASFQHTFFTILKDYIPEFEEQTGMTVDLQLSAFPVYNQQADLELSSGGDAYDFVNVTFILAARWVAANLLANLDEFTSDPNKTPDSWMPEDFVEGAQVPYLDENGNTFGFAWEGGAMVMGLSRMDLMEKKGLAIPTTFEEMEAVCREIHGTENVTGFVGHNIHHWGVPPYMHGFGGNVFADPPGDITPMLNAPETVSGVAFYANLLRNYGPQGVITYTEDQARQAMLTGRSNMFVHASGWVTPILLSNDSQVKETAAVARMPAGPVNDFPASNSQGLGIPKNARNKDAAWEFIKWALSPELSLRIVEETGHSSLCRRSVINSDVYRATNVVNGQDIGALYMEVLEQPAKTENYMAYRTVKEFPLMADILNKAVEQVASGQLEAQAAMDAAQEQAISSLRRAGVDL